MSGPNPPEREPEAPDSAAEPSPESGSDPGLEHVDDSAEIPAADQTGQTDAYSRAYSAPESEHFVTGPYVPADLRLYDYDGYEDPADHDEGRGTPRWPWVVGVAAIVAAIALVVSVSLLVTRTSTTKLANPGTTATRVQAADAGRNHDHQGAAPAATTASAEYRSPDSHGDPDCDGDAPLLRPPPAPTSAAPPPATTTAAAPPPTSTTPAGPRQVTYSVTGTKAPGDIISVTYVDPSGRRRTQHNVYIPWSITVTPISQSDVGSVEASSLFRVSRLNCSITASDGTVLSSNNNDAPQTSC